MGTLPSSTPSSPASLTLPTVPAFREKLAEALLECPDNIDTTDSSCFREKLAETLHTPPDHIFATGGSFAPPEPCLTVDNIPIALPLTPQTASFLASTSAPAPFGSGPHTIVDQTVRRCLQVDATRVGLSRRFQESVYEIVADASEALGVHDDVDPQLYKLILYQDGGFFVPHRDTEKEDGMFATLVVQLPSKHEDGGLVVWHRGQEKKFVYAQDSDKGYFYAAFYADCEHQALPVRGNRLVLVYNLIRSGHSDITSSPTVVDTLREVANDWEQVKGEPNKLVLTLHHSYTDANLSFSLLKGRDAVVVDALQESEMFDLYLALVEKKKHGSAEEDWDDDDPYAEPDEDEEEEDDDSDGSQSVEPDRESPYADSSGTHKMIECYNESFETLEWIDEDDSPAGLGTLTLDVDMEMVDDEDPFTGTPDDEDYEVTGNEGATVDYFYRRAVLVFWPKSRRYANLCAGDYSAHVKELIANSSKKGFVAKRLGTLIQYAVDHVEKARNNFTELLQLACKHKDVHAVQLMMSLFGKPQSCFGYEYYGEFPAYDAKSDGKGAGICTRAHVDAFLEGIKLCGLDATKEKIEAAVSVTSTASLHQCAEFAIQLSKMHGFQDVASFVGKSTANQAMSREFHRQSDVHSIAEMMFTLPTLAHLRDIYLTKAKNQDPHVQFQIIQALHKHSSTADSFPNFFGHLVKEFARRTLGQNEVLYNARKCDIYAEQVGDMLSILVRPPRNEELLEAFVQEILDCESEKILKTVLCKPKIGSAVGEAQISRLAKARVSQLLLKKPVFSQRQPDAKMEGHPNVEEFLRGDEKVMVYQNFNSIKEARRFASAHFQTIWNGRRDHSATAVAEGRGRDSQVVITKTDEIYHRGLQRFADDCKEFARIKPLLCGKRNLAKGENMENDNKRGRICSAATNPSAAANLYLC